MVLCVTILTIRKQLYDKLHEIFQHCTKNREKNVGHQKPPVGVMGYNECVMILTPIQNHCL